MNRRGFLTGLTAALCAPAIIRTPGLIMPVKVLKMPRTTRVFFPVENIVDRNMLLTPGEYAGQPVMMFRGIPVLVARQITFEQREPITFLPSIAA